MIKIPSYKRNKAFGIVTATAVIGGMVTAVPGCASLGEHRHYGNTSENEATREQVKLFLPKHIALDKRVTVIGKVTSITSEAAKAKVVSIQRKVGSSWQDLGHATLRVKKSQGRFDATFELNKPGKLSLKATIVNPPHHKLTIGVSLTVTRRVLAPPLYAAVASYYTDYGLPTACGGPLGRNELGVVNKTLPCGTPILIRYHNRYLTVPVVDRGPYVAGRDFDLTGATAKAIHFNFSKGVDTIYTNPRS